MPYPALHRIYAGYIGVLNFTYNLLWWVVVWQQRSAQRKGWRPPTSMILSYLGFPCYVVAVGIVSSGVPSQPSSSVTRYGSCGPSWHLRSQQSISETCTVPGPHRNDRLGPCANVLAILILL